MRYQRARRETRPEESGTREGQVSRSRVWSTTFNGAKRSVKGRTESACGIWKHDMFLAGASLWGVMGEDVILEKVIGCGKWKPGDGEHKKLKKFGCKVEERQWRFFPYVSCSTFVSHIVGDVTHTAFFLRNELIVFYARTVSKEARSLTKPWPVAVSFETSQGHLFLYPALPVLRYRLYTQVAIF